MDNARSKDWCLGFEEMEPCCQKEILMQRKEAEFRRKIKEFDRSSTRNSTRDEVFSKIATLSNCGCCQSSKDYPLLQSLRDQQMQRSGNTVSEIDSIRGDDDSVDDEGDDAFDDFDYMSPTELFRLEQVKTNMIRRESYQLLGYGIHVDDSISHLLSSLQDISTPMVIHIYDPHQKLCALVDLALETIAQKYIGCRFRRIMLANCTPLLQHLKVENASEPLLLCLKERALVECINIRRHFDTGSDFVVVKDIERYLEHLHMLAVENPEIQQLQFRLLNADDDDDHDDESPAAVGSSNEGANSYCGETGCCRNFPHTHIGTSSSGGGHAAGETGGGGLLSGHNSEGAEVFERNHFLKI